MPTTFWANRAPLSRLALASMLAAGCMALSALPACAATDATQAANPAEIQKAKPANSTASANTLASTDTLASADGSAPVLKLIHKAGKTRLEIRLAGGKVHALPLKTDASVNPKNPSGSVELVASIANKTLLIQDNHASRHGPLSMCQAGQESFLRVIQLAPLKEILSLKLASCRDNMELATPGLTWQADTASLKINWLSGPDHTTQEKTLQIGADGKATLSISPHQVLLKPR